jgi:hypothetical protein
MDFLKNLFSPKQTSASNTNFNSFVSQFNTPKTQPQANIMLPSGKTSFVTPTQATAPIPKATVTPIRPVSSSIPADTLSMNTSPVPQLPPAPVPSVFNTMPTFSSDVEMEKVTKTPSLRDSVTQRMSEMLAGGSNVDTSALREELRLDEKRKTAKNLENQILVRQRQLENNIEAMRSNPEKLLNASKLNYQMNEESRKASKELADLSIAYKIASDDFQGVQQTIQAYEQDLKDQKDWELKTLQVAFDFLQNDLTESEKLQIQQNFEFDKIDYQQQAKDFAIQSQANGYQQMLNQGLITPDKIPADVLNYINTTGYVSPEQKTAIASNMGNMDRIFKVITDPKFNQAVGKLRTPGIFDISGDRELIRQNISTVISALTLDNLAKMKGTPSDRDISVVQSATSVLGDPDNIGKFSNERIRSELVNLFGTFSNAVLESPASTPDQKKSAVMSQIKLSDPNKSPQEVAEEATIILRSLAPQQTSFNSAGNASASTGNLPQRNRNPGNIKQGGLADKYAVGVDNQGHLIFPDEQTGFRAMQEDIQAKISGNSRFLPANPTLAQLGKVYAEDPNWTNAVARIIGVPPTTRTQSIPLSTLTQAIARQEGYYA